MCNGSKEGEIYNDLKERNLLNLSLNYTEKTPPLTRLKGYSTVKCFCERNTSFYLLTFSTATSSRSPYDEVEYLKFFNFKSEVIPLCLSYHGG